MKNLLIKFLILVMMSPATFHSWAASATFTADTTTELSGNNKRGFYYGLEPGEACNGSMVSFRDGGSSFGNQKVRWFLYTWTPGSSLATVTADLACMRAAGVKATFSPVYCAVQFCDEGVTISQLQAHMVALKPVLYANRDVVAILRMGVLGAWGEWADSGAGLDTVANKILIRNAVLDMTPPEIPITSRYVVNLASWYPTATPRNEAYTGSPRSRFGMFNDCYMSNDNDSFSYPGPTTIVDLTVTSTAAQQRAYAIAQTAFAPFDGETCASSRGGERRGCTDIADNTGLPGGIMNEGPRYHQTYLNRSYYTAFHDAWIAGGCYNSVMNLMGYRFQYDSIVHADTMTRGTTNTFTLTMHNYGWSRIHSARQVQVRLVKAAAADILCTFTPQLRTLEPQATVSTGMQAKCAIPGGATVGNYAVYLEMPDITWPGLTAPGVAYKIQPANANSGGQTWDSTNRRFATGTTVTVD